MPNLTSVTLTAGVPTAGTGTVSTIDNLIGTAGTASAQALTVQGIASGTALGVSGTVTANAGTNLNTSALATSANLTAGTAKTQIVDGSGNVIGSTANAINVNVASGVNPNGRSTPANSAPVVQASQTYKAVAASATATLLGATGASGDWLDSVLVIPATTSPGAVSITDGGGSAITVFTGGATSVSDLRPFSVLVRAVSSGGAGGWKVTTGANVSVIGVGNFT
jgi:hypothetical protein